MTPLSIRRSKTRSRDRGGMRGKRSDSRPRFHSRLRWRVAVAAGAEVADDDDGRVADGGGVWDLVVVREGMDQA